MKGGYGDLENSRSRKRRRLSEAASIDKDDSASDVCEVSAADWNPVAKKKITSETSHSRLKSSISPPPKRTPEGKAYEPSTSGELNVLKVPLASKQGLSPCAQDGHSSRTSCLKASPIQLSTVNGLPASSNIDTVSLGDILGDPLIKECWLFNYLFDVDFIMYIYARFGASWELLLSRMQVPIR